MYVSRNNLETKYLNKKVKITLFDDEIIEGYLYKTGSKELKNNPNLYIPRNYYFCSEYDISLIGSNWFTPHSCIFRVSHIKRIELLGDKNER